MVVEVSFPLLLLCLFFLKKTSDWKEKLDKQSRRRENKNNTAGKFVFAYTPSHQHMAVADINGVMDGALNRKQCSPFIVSFVIIRLPIEVDTSAGIISFVSGPLSLLIPSLIIFPSFL